MKYLFLVCICLTGISCATQKRSAYKQTPIDALKLGNAFADSLAKQGVDTILCYEEICSGCIPGTSQKAFVFWQKGGQDRVKSFDTYRGVDDTKACDDFTWYYFAHRRGIDTATLEKPRYIFSHNSYKRIRLVIGGSEIVNRTLDLSTISLNDETHMINWLYRIKACLFDAVYIPE